MRLVYAAVLLVTAACAVDPLGTRSVVEDEAAIRTDATSYRLEHRPGVYTVRLRAEYTNRTGSTVYLHRRCGYGDGPHRYLTRADGDTTRVWLDEGACITRPLRQPIPVRPGETHQDDVVLLSTESPYAQPAITMAMRTGSFRLVYDVQRTDRVDGWHGVDLLPLEQRVSGVIHVLPPE